MLKNYLKIAWRNLLKNKVTGFINIVGLAIGMAVALMIGLWLQDELTFNKVHNDYDRLTQVYLNQTFNGITRTSRAISLPTRPAIEEKFGSDFKHISLASWNFQHILANGENRIIKRGMFVEPIFPEMFSFELLSGKLEDVLKEPNSILLSESVAKTLFGNEEAFGKIIRFDAESDLLVTGVFKDLPKNSEFFTSEIFVPWEFYRSQNEWVRNAEESWGNHSFQMFAQVNDQADFKLVSQKIQDIEKEHNPESVPEYHLFPMSKWHLYSEFEDGENAGGRIQYVWLFGIIGVFVLILACINFMNLSTARSEKRAKEVGVRKTIGSRKIQLIWQFLSESLMVSTIALMLSLALVQISLSWFNDIADKELNLPWTNLTFWLGIMGFALFTGLLAGSYPAFYLSSFKPLKVLKGTFKTGRWAALPRQVLVTLQFTVSVALIIGTFVVFKQIQFAKNRPVGYDREGVVQFFDNAELEGKHEVLRNDLLQTGKVEEVSHSSGPITNVWSNQSGFDWEGKDPNLIPSFAFTACSHEFGKTVGWEILEGRDFSRSHALDTNALVINETAVELIGIENIVGKTIEYSETPHQVIGIVKDMVMESPWEPIKPTVFKLDPDWVSIHSVKLKAGIPIQESLASVQNIFEKLSPSSPFEYDFVDEEFNEKFQAEERIGSLAKVFAFLAIFISCLGLFGLSAFVAEKRTKEIGIRKVLGATVTNLWAMQSKGFLGLVLLSSIIAIPISWYYLESWLGDYDYRIDLNWTVFLFSTILAIIVTLITVSFQSVKAALSNPSECLKSE